MATSLLMNADTTAETFPFVYRQLLEALLDEQTSVEEHNKRTGHRIRMLPHPASFAINLADGLLPVAGNRKLFPKTAAAEVAWFLSGATDVTWIAKHCPIWNKFVEDDGVTIKAAYGYRWRHHFGRDQITEAIAALLTNPSDRRIVISAWDPAEDGLGRPGKNVPCPTQFTLSLVPDLNGQLRLNSAYFLRSSDVFVGLPYDVMGHALLMDLITQELNLRFSVALGAMHVTLAHPHLYDSHYAMAHESLSNGPVISPPRLPGAGWTIGDVEAHPDGYVEFVKTQEACAAWPAFCPRPEVVE